jgi:hypothetical protein
MEHSRDLEPFNRVKPPIARRKGAALSRSYLAIS